MNDPDRFERELAAAGFAVERKGLEPGAENREHSHDLDVRGLVTAGRFGVEAGGERRDYGPGETFFVPAGRPHREVIGPEGARVILGRRAPRD